MKVWKKAVSVGLSLVMCAGMVAPAFAQDAYYIVKIDGEAPELTDEQKDAGKGYSTKGEDHYVFIGKGEAPDDAVESFDGQKKPFENGLPEDYVVPSDDPDRVGELFELDGNRSLYVKPFHDIGDYVYDDPDAENAEDTVAKYTYTVEWDKVSGTPNAGYEFDRSEATLDAAGEVATPNKTGQVHKYFETVRVDGTATLHENTEVKVVVKEFKDGEHTELEGAVTETKYVRDTIEASSEVVERVAGQLAESYANAKDYSYSVSENEDGSITATYEEKTYQVIYQIRGANSGVDVSDLGGEKGKVSEEWVNEMLAPTLGGIDSGAGTYSFTGWNVEVDEETGNVMVTAICTFTPYVFDFDTPEDEVEIDDVEVPLAGLFTRADAIGYLWQQAGEPEAELSDFEDVPEDHQWAVAIGWAQDMGIALPDLEGNFRPDDLVERFVEDAELKPEGELEEFLNRYAVYAGIELADGELFIELGGEPDDIVMGEDAQVIFDDFFAKLETALSQAA